MSSFFRERCVNELVDRTEALPQIFIEQLSFRFQPIIEGMAILSTALLVEPIGQLSNERSALFGWILHRDSDLPFVTSHAKPPHGGRSLLWLISNGW